MRVTQVAGFRTQYLLPGRLVSSIRDDRPDGWEGSVTVEDGVYRWRGKDAFLHVTKEHRDQRIIVMVTALQDVWLQAPALTAKVSGQGLWRGFGRNGRWVRTRSGAAGWLPMRNKDARYVTVHFIRDPSSIDFCCGIEYREDKRRVWFKSDGTFSQLLKDDSRMTDEWHECRIFDADRTLQGVVHASTFGSKVTWELAGHPEADWFHMLGWPGGAGVVVQNKDPYYAHAYYPDIPIDHLWAPELFRLLRAGQRIHQSVEVRWPNPLT